MSKKLVAYFSASGITKSAAEKLAGLMEDAFLHEKDTRALVPRKGFGCACVL